MTKTIFTEEYSLIEPYQIVKKTSSFSVSHISETIVQPLFAGICGSDLAYFCGQKDASKLRQRLPVIPLHEGIVRVVQSSQRGVIYPLIECGQCPTCVAEQENICPNAKFMGSTMAGLSRSLFAYSSERILPLSSAIPLEIATLTEPASIVYRSINEIVMKDTDTIIVIGDGALAYLCVLFITQLKKIPSDHLIVLGIHEEKLLSFRPFATTINTTVPSDQKTLAQYYNQAHGVVEAVGGSAMQFTLPEAIKLVRPGGFINVLGITDKLINLNLNAIVNKGLILQGKSRSKIEDFKQVLLMMEDQLFQQNLRTIIDPNVFFVSSADDLAEAFHYASSGHNKGKVLVKFNFDS